MSRKKRKKDEQKRNFAKFLSKERNRAGSRTAKNAKNERFSPFPICQKILIKSKNTIKISSRRRACTAGSKHNCVWSIGTTYREKWRWRRQKWRKPSHFSIKGGYLGGKRRARRCVTPAPRLRLPPKNQKRKERNDLHRSVPCTLICICVFLPLRTSSCA